MGVVSGRSDQALLEEVKKARNLSINSTSFPDLNTAGDALRNGQVDAVIEDQVTLLALTRTANDLRLLPERLSRIPIGIALPTDDSALRDMVNLSLQDMFADGTYGAHLQAVVWHCARRVGTMARPGDRKHSTGGANVNAAGNTHACLQHAGSAHRRAYQRNAYCRHRHSGAIKRLEIGDWRLKIIEG